MLRMYNQRRASTEHDELFGQRFVARCELRTSLSNEGDGRGDALMAFGLDTNVRQCQKTAISSDVLLVPSYGRARMQDA